MNSQPPKISRPNTQISTQSYDWPFTEYAKQLFESEAPFVASALRQISGPRVLQVGRCIKHGPIDAVEFPQLVVTETSNCANNTESANANSILADPAFLPFEPNLFASVLLPHVLESHSLPHQVLREAHRVLSAEGHIVLTGINKFSLVGVQKIFSSNIAPKGPLYTFARVRDCLQLLGFELVGSDMFQYAPLSKSSRIKNSLGFLDSVGDRWLPMSGAGYIMIAKKREIGLTLIGKAKTQRISKQKVAKLAGATCDSRKSMH